MYIELHVQSKEPEYEYFFCWLPWGISGEEVLIYLFVRHASDLLLLLLPMSGNFFVLAGLSFKISTLLDSSSTDFSSKFLLKNLYNIKYLNVTQRYTYGHYAWSTNMIAV